MYTQRACHQATLALPQLAHRQRGAPLLCALMVTAALPLQTCNFTLQIIDLTQGWSNAVAERTPDTDRLAVVAAVHIDVKLHFTPQQRYLHSRPQQPKAFAAQRLRRSPYAAPALRGEHIIQQVFHQEFSLLQQPLRPKSGSKFANCDALCGNIQNYE